MHFYQAVTTNFLFDISTNYYTATSAILEKIKAQTTPYRAGAFAELGSVFAYIEQRLGSDHDPGLRPIDLIEGAAVHATYRFLTSRILASYADSAEGFEDYLWERFRDASRDHYSRAYRLARQTLGEKVYFAFSKLTYVALCTEKPTQTFSSMLASLRGRTRLDFRSLSVTDLGRLFGFSVEGCLPLARRSKGLVQSGQDPRGRPYLEWLEANPVLGARHPVLGPYLALLDQAPQGFDVLAFAAEPLRDTLLRPADGPKEAVDDYEDYFKDLVPPLMVFTDATIVMGLAKKLGNDYVQAIIHCMAMIGLVERLTMNLKVETPGPHRTCPHHTCPVHATGLCWRYYAFPAQDYKKCTFPQRASQLLGRDLDLPWP